MLRNDLSLADRQQPNAMKVAFVNQPWDTISPPVSAGSIPIWTYETAKRLSQSADVREIVIYARRDPQQAATETYEGIEYRRVSVAGSKLFVGLAKLGSKLSASFRYLNSRLYFLPYIMRVAADLRRQQCDIVHIHNFSQFVPIIRAFNPQIKIVLHMHCEWLTQFKPEVIAPRLAKTDRVFGCSQYITNKVRERFPERFPEGKAIACGMASLAPTHQCQTVFNGVDTYQFVASSKKTDLNLLFVGRVSPEKGLHTLVDAFLKIADDFPTAQLYIIGSLHQISSEFIVDISSDPLVRNLASFHAVNYLAHLKDKLPPKISDRVIFTGSLSHLSLETYFQEPDILINPSVSEAFGMSLVEAMATSKPTIATAVGGMPEIVVQGKTGLVVPPECPDEMAEAISRLLSDESLRMRMGEAGRARAVEMFSWEAIASTLQDQYNHLLSTKDSIPRNSTATQALQNSEGVSL